MGHVSKTQGNKVYRLDSACLLLQLMQVVKRIWAHIKEHDLQNPQDRRKLIPDEVLGTFLTAPVNMMSMNSQLSKHCFTKGTLNTHLNHCCEICVYWQWWHNQLGCSGNALCNLSSCIQRHTHTHGLTYLSITCAISDSQAQQAQCDMHCRQV